ncbi:MAG: hypothetical protein NWE83_05220 [Candidatus Bathyarchaeota archaeon]|nr:hypothetical protein [Candidatus Bathyarchaeota archaeon]
MAHRLSVVITGIIVTILGCALAFSNMSHAHAILSGFGIAFGGATIALLAKFYLPYKRIRDLCPHCGKAIKQHIMAEHR